MEKYQEDRLEPEVEVVHELEDNSSFPGYPRISRPSTSKKWMIIPIILVGVVFLAVGLWMVLPAEFTPFQKPSESPELKALKEEIKKLRAEAAPLKKEIQSLQEGQKTLQEQVTILKDQLTVLAKKTEALGEKKAVPKRNPIKHKKGTS